MPRRKKEEIESKPLKIEEIKTVAVNYGENLPKTVEILLDKPEKEILDTFSLYKIVRVGKKFNSDGKEFICVTIDK